MAEMTKQSVNRGRQLKFVREYYGYSQSAFCKLFNGISQPNLSKFESGFNVIAEDKLKNIMNHFKWPFDFLDRRIDIQFENKYW